MLYFTERREQAKRHVKGCPGLPYISRARMESLLVMEPDLILVELADPAPGMAVISHAHTVPASALAAYVALTPQRSVFVLYDSGKTPVNWRGVERIVNRLAIRNVFVLRESLEDWRRPPAGGVAIAS